MDDPVTSSDEELRSSPRPAVWVLAAAVFLGTFAVGMLALSGTSGQSEQVTAEQAAAVTASSAAAGGEKIDLPSLGLSIVRPAEWVTISADENAQNLRSIRMDDPEFQRMVALYANSPIVAMAKYPEPHDDLNPSLKINVRPIGGFASLPPEQILTGAIPIFRRGFGDIKILEGPSRTTIAGKPAGFVRLSYTLHAPNGDYPTISELWVVPSGPVYFMIGSGTRADEKNGSRAKVRAILDSLRIR